MLMFILFAPLCCTSTKTIHLSFIHCTLYAFQVTGMAFSHLEGNHVVLVRLVVVRLYRNDRFPSVIVIRKEWLDQ